MVRICWSFSDVHAKLYHRPLLHLFRKHPFLLVMPILSSALQIQISQPGDKVLRGHRKNSNRYAQVLKTVRET
jgi:hypothetical protein